VEFLLDTLARRDVVIGLAIVGAGLATLGSLQRKARRRLGETLVYLGYALTGASILLFIVAGFRS
jgi:hypothetical protein